jgi:two-component sensor histidine kinase
MERELLIHELSHRVKNVFAVIQSMAAQTRARNQSATCFREAFLGRLAALARAHCMLLDAEWQGASLDMLVANAVQAYLTDHPQAVDTAGDPIALTPGHSVAISMVLHELGTNAAKTGRCRTRTAGCGLPGRKRRRPTGARRSSSSGRSSAAPASPRRPSGASARG